MSIALHGNDLAGAVSRATDAVERAESSTATARRLIAQSRHLRSVAATAGSPRFFVVAGEIEGSPVRAAWFRGSLIATEALLRRAALLVDLGEEFADDEGVALVQADLSQPVAAMLTFIRACDRVRAVRLGLVLSPRASGVRM